MNLLIIPDYHAINGVDNDRAHLLGQHAALPLWDAVVFLGDWWDFPSLCRWSSKSEHEGKRVKEDFEVGEDAMEIVLEYIRAKKKKMPDLYFLEGNHEARVDGICNDRPEFVGVFDQYGPKPYLRRRGFEVLPYKSVLSLAGWHFTHCFPSGIMGKPTGGKNVGNSLIMNQKVSCVQGHNHVFDHKVVNRADGKPVHGITAGCFIHPTHTEGWNRSVRHLYHLGVLELHNAADGDASISWVRMEDL